MPTMTRGVRSDPEAEAERRRKISEAAKRQWADDEVRAKHSAGRRRAHAEGRMGDYSHFKGLSGEQTSQWKGDDVGYRAMHTRLLNAYGSASDYECVDCGDAAKEWSFVGGPGLYSTDFNDYDPRCRPCHRRFDKSFTVS